VIDGTKGSDTITVATVTTPSTVAPATT